MNQSQLRQLIRECINEINIETPPSGIKWSKKYKLPWLLTPEWVDKFRPVRYNELNSILQQHEEFQFGAFGIAKIPSIDESTWLIADIYYYPDDFSGRDDARNSDFKEFWDGAFNNPDRTWGGDMIQYYFDGTNGPALSAEQIEDISIKYINVFSPA